MKSFALLVWACVMLAIAGARYRLGEWQWMVDTAVACGLIAGASYYHHQGRAR